ncbi:MAG: MATE family efflux transporter, partial [Clostridium sp.]
MSIKKTFLRYVYTNIIGMIGLSCYILADTFFISKEFGADGLTSLNLAISIYSFINATGLMIGIGSATKYSIYKAQNKHNKANTTFTNSIKMGVLAGILFLLIGLFGSSVLSSLLGANKNTFDMTNTYLKTILFFAPFFILNNIFIAFIKNDGNPKLSMAGMLIGSFS